MKPQCPTCGGKRILDIDKPDGWEDCPDCKPEQEGGEHEAKRGVRDGDLPSLEGGGRAVYQCASDHCQSGIQLDGTKCNQCGGEVSKVWNSVPYHQPKQEGGEKCAECEGEFMGAVVGGTFFGREVGNCCSDKCYKKREKRLHHDPQPEPDPVEPTAKDRATSLREMLESWYAEDDAIRAERDALREQNNGLYQSVKMAQAHQDELRAERDALRDELEEARAEIEGWHSCFGDNPSDAAHAVDVDAEKIRTERDSLRGALEFLTESEWLCVTDSDMPRFRVWRGSVLGKEEVEG